MLNTTVGQLLVNEALPDELRDYNRVLDNKGMHALLQQVAREHPDKYREVSFKLNQVGQRSAQDQGGMSFSARHLKRSPYANETRSRIQAQLGKVLDDDSLTDEQRAAKVVRIVGKEMEPQQKAILEEAIKDKNPLAMQVLSGSRGKPMNLASLLGADMLYSDHRDEVIPIPVLRSYSEGLTPEEYWAGTYGARRGIIATKFATQEAGFLSKQLNQAGHRLVVMDEEGEDDDRRGMVVDTDDMDNEGSLLARDMGPYKRNTPLTPKILKHLKRLGKNRILIRSPLVGGSPEGGVYARDVGIRETGKLPGRGEQVGLQAAQALSEPISQGQLSAKHSGGVAGQEKAVGGFQAINQLIQVPKKMQGGAAHSEKDGIVQRVEKAPAGGHYVTINDKQHYVGEGFDVKVKKGDEIEAGDLLSNGIPNPALIVKYKGVGEGRRYFVNEFRKAMAGGGMQGHRRNIELLARGLINHVKMTDETDEHAPDDIIPYSTLEHTYKPRGDSQLLAPKKAVGQYLERPVLHYTIGTKIRPSMLKDFEEFGITDLPVHKEPPPFQPHMVRGMYTLQHDPDWMTQMYGSGLKKSLLNSTARGATSDARGTSFVSSLAEGSDFGEVADRAVIQPKPSYELPKIEPPAPEEEKLPAPAAPPTPSFFGGRFKTGMHKQAEEPKVPTAPKTPATQSLAAPLAPTPAPTGAGNMSSNIMPSSGPTAQDFMPAPGQLGSQENPNGIMPPDQLQQYAQNAQQQNDRGMRMVGVDPMSDPFRTQTTAATPPPSTPAQARADQVQQQRSYGSGNTQTDMRTLFAQAPSRTLAGNSLARKMRRGDARTMGIQAARQRAQQIQNEQAARRNLYQQAHPQRAYDPIPGPSVAGPLPAEQSQSPVPATGEMGYGDVAGTLLAGQHAWTQGGRVWNAAAKGEMLTHGSQLGKSLNPGAQKGVQTVNQLARTAAHKTPGLGRFVAATSDDAARAAGASSKGLSKALGPAAFVLEVGLIGKDNYDKTQEGQTFGRAWKEQADEHGANTRGLFTDWDGGAHEIYQKPIDVAMHVLSPVATVQEGTQLAAEVGGGLGDMATGAWNFASDAEGRNRAAAKAETEQMMADRQEALSGEQDQIRSTLENNKTISPMQKEELRQRSAELDLRKQEAQLKADAATDETEGWQLGKQHTFGTGGHYFRDAMAGTGNRLSAKIEKLQANQDSLTPEQQFDLKNMIRRRDEMKRLGDFYSREVGYFGEGDFTKIMRIRVRNIKVQSVELARRLREPAVKGNPQLTMELEAEMRHQQTRLANMKSWARQAKNQKVK